MPVHGSFTPSSEIIGDAIEFSTSQTLLGVIASSQGWVAIMSGQCSRCVFEFMDARGRACVAFPTAIPAEIRDGAFDHTKPYLGDGGIRFVPRSDKRLPGDPQGTHHLDFGEWTPSAYD